VNLPDRRDRAGVRIDGWDIRDRWFDVVWATPRLGGLRRGETILWRLGAVVSRWGKPGLCGSHRWQIADVSKVNWCWLGSLMMAGSWAALAAVG
jgi:hypothetical protein